MAVAGLEINDAGVVLGSAGRLLVESPGYALEDDTGVWVGESARARARLAPRLVNHGFWERLDAEPATRPVGHARTHADLVAMHLERVWEHREADTDGVILAVPGSLGREQLGLLLGVAEAIALPVRGLVDRALAALGDGAADGDGLHVHVEAGLHGVVASLVEQGESLAVLEVRRLEAPGLLAMDEALAMCIAGRFVRDTRFDPRHSAASEQALYGGLRGWLQRLADSASTTVELGSSTGARHVVQVDAAELHGALEPAIATLAAEVRAFAPPGSVLGVGHQLGAMPFVAERLGAALGTEPARLARGAAALGAARHAASIARTGPRTVTRRLGAPAPAPPPRAAPGPPPRPTHVVHEGVAHRIAGECFAIARDAEPATGLGLAALPAGARCVLRERGPVTVLEPEGAVSLNGRTLAVPEPVSAGDRLGFPGSAVELLLVAVSDGASA